MRKTWMLSVLVATVLLSGCTGQLAGPADEIMVPSTGEDELTEFEGLPAAAPEFAAHFTDPVYDDPANELAPFGSDEGWDLLYEWDERRDELQPDTTVADLIEKSGFAGIVSELDIDEGAGIPAPGGQIDAATIAIGAGFTLLRLTGHIDEEGRQQTLKALDILIRRYDSPPELLLQRDDLQSWTG